MCILSDSLIEKNVRHGLLIASGFNAKNVTPNGYDLSIGEIRIGGITYNGKTRIPPLSPFLISTVEYLRMPDNITGSLWLRSSFSRRGVIGSFGYVDAGFEGELTLSFLNASNSELTISAGERIVQIVFEKLCSRSKRSYPERSGNYHGSRGITEWLPNQRE